MSRKTAIAWFVRIVAHGLAWVLAAKLGQDAAAADANAAAAAQALGSLLLVAASAWDSYRHRQKLLQAPPPEPPTEPPTEPTELP